MRGYGRDGLYQAVFPIKEIMGGLKFNFAPKFPQNGGFSAAKCCTFYKVIC